MTKCFAVNSNNDMFIAPSGSLAINTGLASVMQNCAHAAKAQLGEMVLAFDRGVPNFQTIWRDAANVAQFEAFVRGAISRVIGVIEITEFEVAVETNRVTYSATISTIYGEGQING